MARETPSPIESSPTVELINDGYALCEEVSLNLVFCNDPFRKWLSVNNPCVPLSQVIADVIPDILFKRLDKRGHYSFYFEVNATGRDIPSYLEASFKRITWEGQPYIGVQVRDASKIKESSKIKE